MKLSAPVYRLKRNAKLLARKEDIPLHEALDRIAVGEGFSSWSLLAAKSAESGPAGMLVDQLMCGELLLLGARPGQGKTLLGLELVVEAMKRGDRGLFFTLEYTEKDVADRFRALGVDREHFGERFELDSSDAINAAHIIGRLATAPRGTLVVIDYLQLLDQRRDNPALSIQVRALKAFARERGLIMVFLSQIHRSYDPASKAFPDLADVRLPNPLDLTLFDKTCFLNNGKVRFGAAGWRQVAGG